MISIHLNNTMFYPSDVFTYTVIMLLDTEEDFQVIYIDSELSGNDYGSLQRIIGKGYGDGSYVDGLDNHSLYDACNRSKYNRVFFLLFHTLLLTKVMVDQTKIFYLYKYDLLMLSCLFWVICIDW